MNGRLALVTGLAALAALLAGAAAEASCIYSTPAQLRERADVIFDGVALEGPTATGVQRFRVIRYRKARGPSVVRVQTGTTRRADGTGSTTSVALYVKKGDRWRIFARGSAKRVLQSNLCDGSRRLSR